MVRNILDFSFPGKKLILPPKIPVSLTFVYKNCIIICSHETIPTPTTLCLHHWFSPVRVLMLDCKLLGSRTAVFSAPITYNQLLLKIFKKTAKAKVTPKLTQ